MESIALKAMIVCVLLLEKPSHTSIRLQTILFAYMEGHLRLRIRL